MLIALPLFYIRIKMWHILIIEIVWLGHKLWTNTLVVHFSGSSRTKSVNCVCLTTEQCLLTSWLEQRYAHQKVPLTGPPFIVDLRASLAADANALHVSETVRPNRRVGCASLAARSIRTDAYDAIHRATKFGSPICLVNMGGWRMCPPTYSMGPCGDPAYHCML
jgi:hypothetical protein